MTMNAATVAQIVNPARAGMIPLPVTRLRRLCCKPRASGDDPYKDDNTAQTIA